jgi:hypothetical protein
MRGRGFVLAFGFLLMSSVAGATTYVLNPTGGGDFPNIQAAVDAAANGDVIELLDGTYTGAGNRDIDFHGKAITVRSQRGDPESCVLDVGGAPSSPHLGFRFHTGEGPSSKVKGISISGGYASATNAAAIHCESASPGIEGCRFTNNRPENRGVVIGHNSSITLMNCIFIHNSSRGLALTGGTCIVAGCEFIDNTARDGAGIWLDSGFYGPTHILVRGCRFNGNSAAYCGGAIFCGSEDFTECVIDSCDFRRNYAYQDGSAIYAGGFGNPWEMTINQSTIVGNEDGRESTGGSIYGYETGMLHITNCIVAFNRGTTGGVFWYYGTMACTDLYGNERLDYSGFYPLGHDGNISEDPLFCGLESGDYTINASSPCAPTEETPCALIGLYPVGCGGSGVADLNPGTNETIRVVPNPTAGACAISLADRLMPAGATTRGAVVQVLDASGRLVRSLAPADVGGRDDANDDGLVRESVLWDGRDASGRAVPSGVYFIRATGGGRSHGPRLTVIR